jgi:AcrR family transcriptional regulator
MAKTKGDKRQRTRAALIDAAALVIAERGYERMSLEEVASRAGMSRGAIYGNFADKDELILAVIRARWRPAGAMPEPGATFAEQMRKSGEALATALADRSGRAKQALSFQLYALEHEPIRKRLAEMNAEIYRRMEETLVTRFGADALPMRAAQMVRALHALSDGLIYAAAMNPREITGELVVAAFEAFATPPAAKKRKPAKA